MKSYTNTDSQSGDGLKRAVRQLRIRAAQSVASEDFLSARRSGDLATQDRFFHGLRLHNGVFKTTIRGRLDATCGFLVSALKDRGQPTVRLLDVACSSGISTLELHRALQAAGVAAETVGTDLALNATLVEDSVAKCLFAGSGHLMQVEGRGWALRWPPRHLDWLRHPLRAVWVRRLVSQRGHLYLACLSRPSPAFKVTNIPLTSGAVESVPGLSFAQEDMLHPLDLGAFDLVRAANVLNLGYFSPHALSNMVASLRARLRPGGMLLVVRSEGEINHGTLFALSENSAEIIGRLGRGSEIEDIVISASRQAAMRETT